MQSRSSLFQSRILQWYFCGENTNPCLILVHGFCEDHRVYNPLAKFLAQHYYVILPDLPGFGGSEAITDITMEGMANAIQHIVESEKIHQAALIGHSMGGYVSLTLAKSNPKWLKGLGLLNSTARADSTEKKENRLKVAEFVSKQGTRAFVRTLIPNLFKLGASENLINNQAEDAASCSEEGVIMASLAMRLREDFTLWLQQCPYSLYWGIGLHDQVVAADDCALQAAMAPQSRIFVFQNSGHMAMLEETEKTFHSIFQWMEELKMANNYI